MQTEKESYLPPILIPTDIIEKVIQPFDDGVVIEWKDGPQCMQRKLQLSSSSIFDLLTPTYFGLLEDLLPGTTLMDEFYNEWEKAQDFLVDDSLMNSLKYGQWFYYPSHRHLVRYAPKIWHKLALIVRNSSLIYPDGYTHDWRAARKILDNATIACAGASVGSKVLLSSVMMLNPKAVKIADPKSYNMNNANRVRLRYDEINRNKAIVCAEQIHARDPFIDVFPYSEGIANDNLKSFIYGRGHEEPKATIVIEETDDPHIKIAIRKMARLARLPLVMVTDAGCGVQVDIRRFDLDDKISLFPFVDDGLLISSVEKIDNDLGNRERFLEAAYLMSGRENLKSIPDFDDILKQNIKPEFAGIPQLESTAAIAGGLASWMISRILLGYSTPQRIFLNTGTLALVVNN